MSSSATSKMHQNNCNLLGQVESIFSSVLHPTAPVWTCWRACIGVGCGAPLSVMLLSPPKAGKILLTQTRSLIMFIMELAGPCSGHYRLVWQKRMELMWTLLHYVESEYVWPLWATGWWVLGTYPKKPWRSDLHCPGPNRLFPFRPSHLSFFPVKKWDDVIPQGIGTSPGHASRVLNAFPGLAAASLCLSCHHFNGNMVLPCLIIAAVSKDRLCSPRTVRVGMITVKDSGNKLVLGKQKFKIGQKHFLLLAQISYT